MDSVQLRQERQAFQKRLAQADYDDDPLSIYIQYVDWIISKYGEDNPSSGLKELLAEVTDAFKADSLYKNDPRYLKLWTLYTHQVDGAQAISIYTFLLKKGIGISQSLLFEEFSKILEKEGKVNDAGGVYQMGIKRQARPVDRLKNRFNEFTERNAAFIKAIKEGKKKPKNHSDGSTASTPSPKPPVPRSTAAERYALMMQAPPPGKRAEKLRFDLSLLYTPENGEFSVQEARARSMGLLGKTWQPDTLRQSGSQPTVGESYYAALNDEGEGTPRASNMRQRNMKNMNGSPTNSRKSLMLMMNGENTVTINTKEALADVFGMYNSPNKTSKISKTFSITPVTPAPLIAPQEARTPSTSFRPFIDDPPTTSKKENKPIAFVPYIDPEVPRKPVLTQAAHSIKDVSPRNENTDQNEKNVPKASIFETTAQKAFFTPAEKKPSLDPLRDVFTVHGKPLPTERPVFHERAKSQHDVLSSSTSSENAPTPFKVFSRPEWENKNTVFSTQPKPAVFKPFRDDDEDNSNQRTPSWPPRALSTLNSKTRSDIEDYDDDFDAQGEPSGSLPIDSAQFDEAIDQEVDAEGYYRERPLGRFDKFNVMTPITERTFEYTGTRSTFADTPSSHLQRHSEVDDEDDEYDLVDGVHEIEHVDVIPPFQDCSVEIVEEHAGKLSLADTLAVSASFKPSNPCNPFDPPILANLLSRLPSDSQYHDIRSQESNLLTELERFTKKARKTSSGSQTGTFDALTYPLVLNGHEFQVSTKLGEGGFGSVFQAQDVGMKLGNDDSDDEDMLSDMEDASLVAIKVVKPRNLWEYHVLRRLHSALPAHLRRSVVLPHALYAFHDESYIILDLYQQGSLLQVVNNATAAGVSQQGACLDELLVMFFAIELLRLLEGMHNSGFIHGDLKIDNCLVRLEEVPGGPSAWVSRYNASGEGGWSYKGVSLIDFGRTIDTRLFPPDQKYIAEWATDDRDCFEIQEGRPWTYQTDYFGMAGIVYCLLFGKYIHANAITKVPTPMGPERYRITTSFKRYWQTDVWSDLFDILLNPAAITRDGHLPITEELSRVRMDMETWLVANCERSSGTLKGLLKRVERSCLL